MTEQKNSDVDLGPDREPLTWANIKSDMEKLDALGTQLQAIGSDDGWLTCRSAEETIGLLHGAVMKARPAKPIDLSTFNTAGSLTEPEDQASLLADTYARGTPAQIDDALGIVAKARGKVTKPLWDIDPWWKKPEWGAEILVKGTPPEWMKADGRCFASSGDLSEGAEHCTHTYFLPAHHDYYTARKAGFKYWPGGDMDPQDWDGLEVLRADGKTEAGNRVTTGQWAKGNPAEWRIIGYRKRATIITKPATIGMGEWKVFARQDFIWKAQRITAPDGAHMAKVHGDHIEFFDEAGRSFDRYPRLEMDVSKLETKITGTAHAVKVGTAARTKVKPGEVFVGYGQSFPVPAGAGWASAENGCVIFWDDLACMLARYLVDASHAETKVTCPSDERYTLTVDKDGETKRHNGEGITTGTISNQMRDAKRAALIDKFAAAALPEILSWEGVDHPAAETAYSHAMAMMAEREKLGLGDGTLFAVMQEMFSFLCDLTISNGQTPEELYNRAEELVRKAKELGA